MPRFLVAMLVGLTLTGCVSSADPVVITRVVKPEVPEVSREPCQAPVALPDRRITAREAVDLWGRDRASLRECEAKRRAAVEAMQ
jgi:hypothetical protein